MDVRVRYITPFIDERLKTIIASLEESNNHLVEIINFFKSASECIINNPKSVLEKSLDITKFFLNEYLIKISNHQFTIGIDSIDDILSNMQYFKIIDEDILCKLYYIKNLGLCGQSNRVESINAIRSVNNLCDIIECYINRYWKFDEDNIHENANSDNNVITNAWLPGQLEYKYIFNSTDLDSYKNLYRPMILNAIQKYFYWDDKSCQNLRTIMNELIYNAVMYGYHGIDNFSVEIRLSVSKNYDVITIDVIDEGKGFNIIETIKLLKRYNYSSMKGKGLLEITRVAGLYNISNCIEKDGRHKVSIRLIRRISEMIFSKNLIATILDVNEAISSYNICSFKYVIFDLLDKGSYCIIINLTHTSFLDSSGVGALIDIHNFIHDKNVGRLYLCNLNEHIAGYLNKLSLEKFFYIYENEQEVFESIKIV